MCGCEKVEKTFWVLWFILILKTVHFSKRGCSYSNMPLHGKTPRAVMSWCCLVPLRQLRLKENAKVLKKVSYKNLVTTSLRLRSSWSVLRDLNINLDSLYCIWVRDRSCCSVYGERYLHNKYEYQHFVINSMQYTNIFNFAIYIQSIGIHLRQFLEKHCRLMNLRNQ